ncbi:trypsin-like cysteine/serine peptidase domain-containing protein [Hyaloraphidium curvatum]|nr:trypsin-like cysteine/serine peptidase domain-containing protein [Hyaloraphidium curvatum]
MPPAQPELSAASELRDLLPSIVKLEVAHSQPNFALPWQQDRSFRSHSTGFTIAGRRILTNAHCVDGAAQIRVRRPGSPRRFAADVLAIGRDCDLAVLTVREPAFWMDAADKAKAAPFVDIAARAKAAALPELEERVIAVGFPTGGDTVSVTSGVVSRVEMQTYSNGGTRLLAVQVDAAINPGNSGGPVFDAQRRFVGIAFQALTQSQNVGYIIPVPVVWHFLEDLERNGRYTGIPALMFETQGLENAALREYLGLPENMSGVLVTRVYDLCPFKDLKPGDVITEIDGHGVADDHTVQFSPDLLLLGPLMSLNDSSTPRSNTGSSNTSAPASGATRPAERIEMEFVVTQHHVGDKCTLTLFRDGTTRFVTATLAPPSPLVPLEGTRRHRGGHLLLPSYRLVGGIVLTVLTESLIASSAHFSNELGGLLAPWYEAPKRYADEEAVVCGGVLPHSSTIGYEGLTMLRLARVCGQEARNLAQVSRILDGATKEAVSSGTKPFLKLEFERGPVAVLDARSLDKDTKEVLELHMVPSDRSEDLLEGTGPATPPGEAKARL